MGIVSEGRWYGKLFGGDDGDGEEDGKSEENKLEINKAEQNKGRGLYVFPICGTPTYFPSRLFG